MRAGRVAQTAFSNGTGIDALRLGHLFAAVVTRDDVANGKPAPDVYLHAAALLGVDPHRCLAVDDAADGITAAASAGLRVLTLHHQQLRWPDTLPHHPGSQAHTP
ncbi:HAD family hydrolase [Plantactinospora soyae]|uniref:HAD family hydrolase n=1 Tax=Plantactinospora soyae TaxID=1544732 RepID=UPI001788F4FF